MSEYKEPQFVKLVTAYDQFNVGSVKGILEDENIPYIEEALPGDNYLNILTGGSLTGTSIYVPEEFLTDAQNLMTVIFGDNYDKDKIKEK